MGRSDHFFLFLYFQHPMSVSRSFLFPFVCKDLKSFSTCTFVFLVCNVAATSKQCAIVALTLI